jgi:(E)-4-hydroxy-3-methylbut-2-enyl-diphosphate synthase
MVTYSITVQMSRRQSRPVRVGNLTIGGGAPVSVQSMCDTKTTDVEATVRQVNAMRDAGCDVARLAVPDMAAAHALADIKRRVDIPLVADIHFDYRLALAALDAGVDKLRLNPGNLRKPEWVRQVVASAKERGVPIRVGVNEGSIDRTRYPEAAPDALVSSAMDHIRILEELDFRDVVISLKAFDVPRAIKAYALMAEQTDYPLHIGITEAGLPWAGTIRSAVGIGALLAAGIGDTLRVSLAGDPVEEVRVGWEILKSLNLRSRGYTLIVCPSCGRCGIDLQGTARQVDSILKARPAPPQEIRVAVMGCVVNGPGEAREAHVGLSGGEGLGLIHRGSRVVRKVPEPQMVAALIEELDAVERELKVDS